jgi:hypothetical protein
MNEGAASDQARYQAAFTDQEWSLLVGLPHSVLSAASAVESDSGRRTLAEGEAGLGAIADGRGSGNALVAAVAAELVDRLGGDPELGEEPPVVVSPEDPATYVTATLDRARAAKALLVARAAEGGSTVGEGDAGAYRHWLVTIAEAVVGAAPTGSLLGFGGESISEAEQTFVHKLTVALGD